MPTTYDALVTNTIGTATSSVTLSSISQSYTDLRLIMFVRTTTTSDNGYLRFNGNSSGSYDTFRISLASGTSATAANVVSSTQIEPTMNSNGFSTTWQSYIIDIMNYTSTFFVKNVILHSNELGSGSRWMSHMGGTWRNTAAINSINISTQSAVNMAVGSRFALYGIARA